jgi:hypothetical protein
MSHFEPELPDDLRAMAERLRRERPRATPLELDQLKLRAMNQASRGSIQPRGTFMRSRLATLLCVGLFSIGAGGTFAVANHDGGGDQGSGGKTEYKPGKGCGDKNHEHAKSDECKKHDGGGGGDNDGDNGHGQGHGDHDGDNGGAGGD